MRNFWIYTAARLGIIIVIGLILQPFMGFTLVMGVAAILIGALLSYLLLGRMRAKVADDIQTRLDKREKAPKTKGRDENYEDSIVDEKVDEENERPSEQ